MTKGVYEEGTGAYEAVLEAYIDAGGNYRTRLWRDPFGRLRDRDGNAGRVPSSDKYDEADEIMRSVAREARR